MPILRATSSTLAISSVSKFNSENSGFSSSLVSMADFVSPEQRYASSKASVRCRCVNLSKRKRLGSPTMFGLLKCLDLLGLSFLVPCS